MEALIYNSLDKIDVYRPFDVLLTGQTTNASYTCMIPTLPILTDIPVFMGVMSTEEILMQFTGHLPASAYKMNWLYETILENDIVKYNGLFFVVSKVKKDFNHYVQKSQFCLLAERKGPITGLSK